MGTKHWRYSVPSEKLEGWAILFLDDAGAFTVVSDYGNFGYIWGTGGRNKKPPLDFRDEILCFGEEYILDKLSYGTRDIIDERATRKEILAAIKHSTLAKEDRRAERALLKNTTFENEVDFWEWVKLSKLQYAAECVHTRRDNGNREAFMKRAWPRLRALIQAEIAAERATTVAAP